MYVGIVALTCVLKNWLRSTMQAFRSTPSALSLALLSRSISISDRWGGELARALRGREEHTAEIWHSFGVQNPRPHAALLGATVRQLRSSRLWMVLCPRLGARFDQSVRAGLRSRRARMCKLSTVPRRTLRVCGQVAPTILGSAAGVESWHRIVHTWCVGAGKWMQRTALHVSIVDCSTHQTEKTCTQGHK